MAIISIDFDGTIVSDEYPRIGELLPNAVDVITRLLEYGHDIIINSCRSGAFEGAMEIYLNDNGIPYNFINSNLPEVIDYHGRDFRKIKADVYIDASNLGGFPTWLQIEKALADYHNIYTHNTEPENLDIEAVARFHVNKK